MQMEENHPGCAATGSGGLSLDDITLIERVEPSSLVAAGERFLVHLSSSKNIACLGDALTSTQISDVSRKEPEQVERRLPRTERKLRNLSSKPGLISEIPGSGY